MSAPLDHGAYLAACLDEARAGYAEGGIPIGAVLVGEDGAILARGRNRYVQDGSVIHHAEMNCLENAGQLPAAVYKGATLYTTLSPCFMCAGAALLLGIPRVVAGENRTVAMGEAFLRAHGVELTVLDDAACHTLLQDYIGAHPAVWQADKGGH
jgi:cytosine/creatinine deaminase